MLLAALVAACEKEGTGAVGGDQEICFDTARYAAATKAGEQPELDHATTFGVWANLKYDAGEYLYIDNQEVEYRSDKENWGGVNSLKWPKGPDGYKLDFLAYAPYSSTPWCEVVDGALQSNGTVSVATIDNTDDNYDLLYSDYSRNATAAGGAVPVLFHHALAAVNVGLNIVRSNDAVIYDPNGRYTYEEWEKTDDEWNTTKVSYIVPIGQHPNDTLGIVLKKGTVLSGPVDVFDPDSAPEYDEHITLAKDFELDKDYIQYQKFGYRLKNSIQNIWIASLVECRIDNIATEGTLEMEKNSDNLTWELPENEVWTVTSSGEAGLAAHSGSITFFEEKEIEVPPHMRSTVHTFPMELHVIPQDLKWSPLTPENNQVLHIKMKVYQFNYSNQNVNDACDENSNGIATGDAATLDYRDIYEYETNADGSFKAYKTQVAELAPGVSYVSMVWRDKVWRKNSSSGEWEEVDFKPTHEYYVEKDILLYDNDNFVSPAPQFWKMNTRTTYITRINFADHLIEFAPSVQPFAETEVEGGGSK